LKPDVALTETRKLVERDRVHLLAGVLGSGFPFGAYVKAKLGYRQLVVAYADYAAGQDMSSGSSRTSRRRGGSAASSRKGTRSCASTPTRS